MDPRDQMRDAERDPTCLPATTTDDGNAAGNAATGTGIGTATRTETVVGTGTGAGAIGTETHVGKAAPEVLEGVIKIDVQVRVPSPYFGLRNSLGIERDRKDYRYDDRRDSDRRDRDDRRRDDRRDDRDRHREDPRDGGALKPPEVKPSPGLKEELGRRRSCTITQDVDPASSPPDPRTTRTERGSRE